MWLASWGGSLPGQLRYLEDSERVDANLDKEWESKRQSDLAGLFVGWAEAHVR